MKAYRTMPIAECGEPLIALPRGRLAFCDPHPYAALGAPYGAASPWMLRTGVAEALARAQDRLETLRPGWRLLLFDALRPNDVQSFMVEREFARLARAEGLDPLRLAPQQRERLGAQVFRLWAVPSLDPATPPPHSTGAALDCTLADAGGRQAEMGSPIDELSDRSDPDYFAQAADLAGIMAHRNRLLLADVMAAQGFRRHPREWWHFSLGDQLWAWLGQQAGDRSALARYGRADLLPCYAGAAASAAEGAVAGASGRSS